LKQLSHSEVEGSTFLQNTGTFTQFTAQQPKYVHNWINNQQENLKTGVSILHGLYREVQDYLQATFPDQWIWHNNMDFPHSDITLTTLLPLGLCQRHCLQADCKLNMGATVDHC